MYVPLVQWIFVSVDTLICADGEWALYMFEVTTESYESLLMRVLSFHSIWILCLYAAQLLLFSR